MSGLRNTGRNPPSQYQNPFQAHSRTWVDSLTVQSSLIIHQNPPNHIPQSRFTFKPWLGATGRCGYPWISMARRHVVGSDHEPLRRRANRRRWRARRAKGYSQGPGTRLQGPRSAEYPGEGPLKKGEKLIGTLIRLLCRWKATRRMPFLKSDMKPMAPPLRRLYHVKAHQLSLP